jgi:hypothetical protein
VRGFEGERGVFEVRDERAAGLEAEIAKRVLA